MVYALGLGDRLVARSPECDFPAEVQAKPVVSRASVDPGASSAAIDVAVRARLQEGASLYEIDEPVLSRLRPTLILTQALCDVCAPSAGDVREVASRLDPVPQVLSFDPHDLGEVLAGLDLLGEATGVTTASREAVLSLQGRLDSVRDRLGEARPEVICLEWLDPPFTAGHWVPDQVSLAGGREMLTAAGQPSVQAAWGKVLEADPEFLLLMPCGMDVERAERELPSLQRQKGWKGLRAVREGKVWLLNGSAYFNRPGPRVVRGVEILARLLHPESFDSPPDGLDARRLI